jgi:AcrR family transcriptional regulator
MAPKIVDKAAKRLEILQSALQVFSQKGVANTKMIDIATAASIGKGTIYEYFKSKEDIFAAGFQHFFDGFEANIESAISQSENPEEQLQILIRSSLGTFFEHHSEFAVIMLDFWAEGIRTKDDTIENVIHLKDVYRMYRSMIVKIIERGIGLGMFRPVNAVANASYLIAAMDGLMLQWVMEPEIFDIEDIIEAICDVLLNGIKK